MARVVWGWRPKAGGGLQGQQQRSVQFRPRPLAAARLGPTLASSGLVSLAALRFAQGKTLGHQPLTLGVGLFGGQAGDKKDGAGA